jgi:trans-aconitate 2-methyltransferase
VDGAECQIRSAIGAWFDNVGSLNILTPLFGHSVRCSLQCYHAARVTTWEPRTYLRYAEVRFRAGLDLIAHIPKNDYRTVYDLGCGTGYLTNALAETFPGATVTGVDSSAEMLAEARRDFPKLSWTQADITAWRPPAPPDLIFSNAALHWLPQHEKLLPSLLKFLRPGGVLAVQMPRHFQSPSHIELRKLVNLPRWRRKLKPLLLTEIASPEQYWKWLSPVCSQLEIWETIYLQILDGQDPVVNFMRGTALRPFLTVLSEKDAAAFLAAFAKRMRTAYPPQKSGQTLFPFRRLFLIGSSR